MTKLKTFLAGLLAITLMTACSEKEDVDEIKPELEFISPMSCDMVYINNAFNVVARLTDNVELGSFSVNIHHNFDQHGHSTEIEECVFDEKKSPVNDFRFDQSYQIDPGNTEFTTNVSITVPDGMDTGDYHLTVTVVDESGWSSFKIISIKVIEKE